MKQTTQNRYFGYCRVSTRTQENDNQKYILLDYANTHKFQYTDIIEVVLSSRKHRKEREIDSLLEILQSGDNLVVSKLDRIGRNTVEVLSIIDDLKAKGVILTIVKDSIVVNPLDENPITTMYLTLLAAVATLERSFISERTKDALAKIKADGGKLGGRQIGSLSNNTQFQPYETKINELLGLGLSYEKIVKHIGVGSKSALYSFVKNRRIA